MKRLPFIFATRADMIALDEEVGRRVRVKYVLTEPMPATTGREFERLEDIPGIGEVPTGSSRGGVSCHILPINRKPVFRRIQRNDGSVVWVADGTGNRDSVSLWSPGVYGSATTLIAGDIATTFDTPIAQATMKAFNSALRSAFSKRGVKGARVFVGPEALKLATAGWRCTIDAGSPKDYDVPVANG